MAQLSVVQIKLSVFFPYLIPNVPSPSGHLSTSNSKSEISYRLSVAIYV